VHHFAVTHVIRFNAFDMNPVAHQPPGLWKHPNDQSWQYADLPTTAGASGARYLDGIAADQRTLGSSI